MFLGDPEFLIDSIKRCGEDAFDKDSNKEGFINLGTAVNSLCWDIIKERLEKVTANDNLIFIIEEVLCCRGTCLNPRHPCSSTQGSMVRRTC